MANIVILALALVAVANASVIRKLTPAQVERLANWNEADKQNIWEISGQYQGDIILNDRQRNGIIPETYRWPDKTIPYVFSPLVTPEQREYIEEAIKVFHEVSCVKLRPRAEEVDYVYITNEYSGCFSAAGRNGSQQLLNLEPYDLGTGCYNPGVIVHEFLHAFGFLHQHMAHNRDDYVNILFENIEEEYKNNFVKLPDDLGTSFGEAYDYGSILHYSAYAGSKNGLKTIETKDPNAEIGQRERISQIDINKLNKMYACDSIKKN